jgi:hypothetical protein
MLGFKAVYLAISRLEGSAPHDGLKVKKESNDPSRFCIDTHTTWGIQGRIGALFIEDIIGYKKVKTSTHQPLKRLPP